MISIAIPAAIHEIQALLTITIPIVSSWQTGGDSSIAKAAYCGDWNGAGNDFEIDRDLSLPLKS